MLERFGNRRGASAVEFALLLPLFLLLVFGIIEFGLLMKDYLTVSHAAREAARYASVMSAFSTAAVQNKAVSTATGIPLSGGNVTVSCYGDDGTTIDPSGGVPSGARIDVEVTYDHPLVARFVLNGISTKRVVGHMSMRRE